MSRPIPVLVAAAFALSIGANPWAEEISPSRPQPARKAIAETGKNAAPRPHVKFFTGTITAFDAAAGTLTLKGQKGEMRFQVQEKAKEQFDGLKIGDKAIVKHVDLIALSIVKPRRTLNRKEKGDAAKPEGSLPPAGKK